MTHAVYSFLSDNTMCGKPVEYKQRGDNKNDLIPVNIVLELEDITCPDCLEKASMAYAKPDVGL